MQPKQSSSSSINSFLFGIVVGALLTLLFTTKKGRKILHMMTEEGKNKFSEVEEILQAIQEEREEPIEEEESVMSETPEKMMVEETPAKKSQGSLKRLASGRKFFRKPTKK